MSKQTGRRAVMQVVAEGEERVMASEDVPTLVSLRAVLLRTEPEHAWLSPAQFVGARVTKSTVGPRTLELELHPRLDQEVLIFLQDLVNNYDHEEDAHKHNNGACRACNAVALLVKLGVRRG